jgi:hypothetical protein
MRMSYFTLQLLYYRMLGLKNKIHTLTAGTWNTWNMEHAESLLSVLVAVTHTHPTIHTCSYHPKG